jgi:hypothetical protein
MTVLPETIYIFIAILTKTSMNPPQKIKIIKKFTWKHKKLQITKQSLKLRAKMETSQYLTSNYTTEP